MHRRSRHCGGRQTGTPLGAEGIACAGVAAEWVVSRIGGEYDLAHALDIARKLLRLPSRLPLPHTIAESATRFICSSLLAHAFALIGTPILPVDHRYLTPGDFASASLFEVVNPIDNRS